MTLPRRLPRQPRRSAPPNPDTIADLALRYAQVPEVDPSLDEDFPLDPLDDPGAARRVVDRIADSTEEP